MLGRLGFGLQLLPQQVQEELLQRLRAQSASIGVGGVLDQGIVLEEVRDLEEGGGVDAVGEERLE